MRDYELEWDNKKKKLKIQMFQCSIYLTFLFYVCVRATDSRQNGLGRSTKNIVQSQIWFNTSYCGVLYPALIQQPSVASFNPR